MSEEVRKEVKADIEFTLSTPIIAYGEEISVLKIRKPTGADLVSVGNPVEFSPFTSPPTVKHDYQKMTEMVARLANVPSSSLQKLDPTDLVSLAWAVTPFFIPAL
ncbi:hypothetical protein AS156_19205 [Bradyrhizobium macuxiense]|uniref:Tail assembly chaperone E/41/14-like protein n=1 Tax=Bradyrhizobium macuxiense TaxID=1755647 RepID=A0A109JFT6_9BRAD|nr:phage tail assembly protein [Bradyrhizobium macuxiense]KWV48039.1 hypothetical protein AS156_19205 [Bradyrhizobium macuxiense]